MGVSTRATWYICVVGYIGRATMGEEGVNMVHKNQLWRDRIESELKSSAEWEDSWGFLKAPRPGQKLPKKKLTASASTPTLESAGKSALQPTVIDKSQFMDDRMKVLDKRRGMTPKDRYGRPITVMHEMGWRPTIEKFGVSHHGVKRDPHLWPEV